MNASELLLALGRAQRDVERECRGHSELTRRDVGQSVLDAAVRYDLPYRLFDMLDAWARRAYPTNG